MDALIAKYFFDELNQEEERQLLDWIAENPENAQQFVHSKKLLTLAESEHHIFIPNADQAWRNINLRLVSAKAAVEHAELSKRKVGSYKFWRIAASFVLVAGLAYGVSSLSIFNSNDRQGALVVAQEEELDELIEITSAEDVKVVYLPDSSVVFLNRNSKIIYTRNFLGDKRNVYLEGESFFDVRPNPDRPFCVYTSNTKTRALGTSFNIRAYPESGETEVTVAHGKVVFFLEGTARDRIMVLESKDKVVFDKEQVLLTKYRDVGYGYMAWINDFDTKLDEVEEMKINDGLLLSPYSKEVVYKREIMDPIRYINNVSNWSNTFEWKNHLVKKTMVEGEIYSSAVVASYTDIKLKATFYNKEDQVIGVEIMQLKQVVEPGSIIEYKRKLDQYFDGTANVIVEIYHAKAQDRI